eukprot:COSAG06_NODE_1811_length_8317_cov_7.969944_2_plen_198_part_00
MIGPAQQIVACAGTGWVEAPPSTCPKDPTACRGNWLEANGGQGSWYVTRSFAVDKYPTGYNVFSSTRQQFNGVYWMVATGEAADWRSAENSTGYPFGCNGKPIYQQDGQYGNVLFQPEGTKRDHWAIGPPERIHDCADRGFLFAGNEPIKANQQPETATIGHCADLPDEAGCRERWHENTGVKKDDLWKVRKMGFFN